jgi:hypothetical protein
LIQPLRIEAALTMHKDNLIEVQKNKKLELQMFRLQQASGERMAAMFAKVVKKNFNRYCSDRSMPRELWFEF